MSDIRAQNNEKLVIPQNVIKQEREWKKEGVLGNAVHSAEGMLRRLLHKRYQKQYQRILLECAALEEKTTNFSDEELKRNCFYVGGQIRKTGLQHQEHVAYLFALLREVSRRTLGLRPHDVQIIAAKILLDGKLAEMATGEGKTLVAGLAATASALIGIPAHVVTVNDYLAERDAKSVLAIMDFLNFSVGIVIKDTPPEQRSELYARPICYCTNKELTFDYLRDRSSQQSQGHKNKLSAQNFLDETVQTNKLSGLPFAIVDEADSILMDEARTPLILSEGVGNAIEDDIIETVMSYADGLENGVDYILNELQWSIHLKETCKEKIPADFEQVKQGPLFLDTLREELVLQALMAKHLYKRNEHYLIKDGKVQIIDEYTGRVMPDRAWGAGLHQMVEFKEGCERTEPKSTTARITYQRFFRRYKKLSGMTGTADEVSREFWNVYGLEVHKVPTHKPTKREVLPDRVYVNKQQKWAALTEIVYDIHAKRAPLLIGVRTVSGCKEVCDELSSAGFSFDVLNAENDHKEADIVAKAGHKGRITVATNMAGRGTDIPLGEGVDGLGGLHVIMTERHDSGRIDRQLMGRCARQGDPGQFQAIASLEDPLSHLIRPSWLIKLSAILMEHGYDHLAGFLLYWGQKKLEREHSEIRERLLSSDQSEIDLLAFSGTPE